MPNVLIIGGRGRIGSGLRTYLSQLDPTYQFASIDLPNATDYAPTLDIEQTFVDCNISEHSYKRDLVIYLARAPARLKQ